MARKDINIGLTGNDGTGDSIRDAFSKVNSNFKELYASQGLEAGLTFNNLVDVVKPLRPNTVLGLDNLGENVISRNIEAANGLNIDVTSDPSKIVFSLAGIQINLDPNPTLSNTLNAANFRLSVLADPTEDQDATTRKWVYQNFLNRDNIDLLGSVPDPEGNFMRSNFKINPTPDNGNPNVGEQIISLKGSDGVTPKTDVFLKFQAVHPAHATRKDYVDSKLSLQGTETIDPATGSINRGFGVMTGPLILNDHPQPYVGIEKAPSGEDFVEVDYRAATKGYVDSKSYSSPTNLFVSTIGNDDMWDFENDRPNPAYGYPEEEIGRSWSKAFKSIRAAAKFAKKYIDRVNIQNNPYKVSRLAISRYAPPGTTALESPRTRVRVNIQNHGYVDGDYVQVSGAILGSLDTRNLNGIFRVNKLDANNFELNLKSIVNWTNPEVNPEDPFVTISLANKKDGPYSLSSRVDLGFRGFFVPKPEITIMIESGVYFEDLPILIPPNVAIKGDEFRRTLIRPKEGPAPAENENLIFVRGDRKLGVDFWYNAHYYRQLARSVGVTNQAQSRVLEIRNAAYLPKSGMRFIWGSTGGIPNVYRVGPARTIISKPEDLENGVELGTYVFDIVDENGDPKPLAQAIPDGTIIEFLLDNEHCDMFLVSDAFQARNVTFLGSKGFAMAFDPEGQILTRSPYAQVCATFAGEGGGGQLIDGMAGNLLCFVQDTSYTDPKSGLQGSSGTKMTVSGLLRKPQLPNTFYKSTKKYVIIESTEPDPITGTATFTLSSATPIEEDDRFLPDGFIPNGSTILIETAGNRSMLSNDFTMVNDLGYGIYAENNGVCEAVSQFTYYCRVSYLAKSGAQLRTVTGSSCYGLIGLQSEGSDPNETIQIGRLKTSPVNIVQPYIADPLAQGNLGSISFIVGGVDSKPLRNSTFKLNKHEIVISNIERTKLLSGTVTSGPLIVTTSYKHPFKTGDEVQMTSVNKGLERPPAQPGGSPQSNDIDGRLYTITVVNDVTFTLNGTESLNYINDLGVYEFEDNPPRAIANFVAEAQDVVYTVKGDPSPRNITGVVRFDGGGSENAANQNTIKVFKLERPAQLGMKFTLNNTIPQVNSSIQIYKVTGISKKLITFKVAERDGQPQDNKIGVIQLYITEVRGPDNVIVTNANSPWAPKAGWTFQLLDTNLNENLDYTFYTVVGTPTYDAISNRWTLDINVPLTVNMVNQISSAQVTVVDGYWDLTLDRNLESSIPQVEPVTISFFDSYWSVNIDPSLSTKLPFETDQYGKTSGRKFNLYQLKTISVSQILNQPPIISSSALRFGATNYDPSVYRILAKSLDGGITKDVYELLEEATPLSGFNTNAVAKIEANRAFIQNETIAYLSTIYPDFVYNQTTCARDVGLILDAITFDLTYGGNVRSRAAGVSYYQQGNPSAALVLSQQKEETIDAINFATTVALTALNKYIGATTPQVALPYRGINLNGTAQLVANRQFIIEDCIAYLTATYGGSFVYNETIFRRDIGIIVDALAYDLEYDGNVKSRSAALRYYDGSEESNLVIQQQKSQTIAVLDHLRNITKLIVLESPVTNQVGNNLFQDVSGSPGVAGVDNVRMENLMTLVINVLTNGPSVAPVRNLGLRRSYQNPLNPTYTPQIINNALVSEEDSDTRLVSLMNQIAAIINLGTIGEHVVVENQILDPLQILFFPPTATSLQFGAILEGPGIPKLGIDGVTENTIIRTVTTIFDTEQVGNTTVRKILKYQVRISAPITQTIPAGTEIRITGPGSDYLFDLSSNLDNRHIEGDAFGVTTTFSTVRATGHDFLQVGAGGFDDSNYPNNVYGPPNITPSSSALVKEVGTGRVFHVSTDQDGNFRVGSLFGVNQGDGSVSINAPIGLAAVSSLSFLVGETVREFSGDPKLDSDSDNVVSTQKAIKSYINSIINGIFPIDNTQTPQKGLLRLDGESVMKGQLNMGLNPMENIVNSTDPTGQGAVNRKYVDNVFAGSELDYDGLFQITTTGKRNEILAFEMKEDTTSLGGVPLNKGGIDLNGNKISRLKSPVFADDATNKNYVDQSIATGGIRTGWTGFTLNDTVTRYRVTGINLVQPGAGYTTPPVVLIYSTSGQGATARAVLVNNSGPSAIANIVVDTQGYGYLNVPSVIIGGSISNVNIVNPGFGYQSAPTITFSEPQIPGGIRATGYAIMEGNPFNLRIQRIVITNNGAGYNTAPTITQTHPDSDPTLQATLTVSLQAGGGAVASAVITATQKDINLNGNRVTGSADPVNPTDLVTWQYFDSKNYIDETNDITITGVPGSGDFLVFTGEVPPGSKGSMVNASVSASSDLSISRQTNSITFALKDGVIDDGNIAANAAILQSKLALQRSRTILPSATPASGDLGIACFNDNQFSSNNGFVQLKQSTSKITGVTFDRMQQITNFRVLGRQVDSEAIGTSGTIQELDANALRSLINLSVNTVSGLVSDDTLGGLFTDGQPSGLGARSDGSASFGAILKTGGQMRGTITFTNLGGSQAINVRTTDNEQLDIGTSSTKFRDIWSRNFKGTTFVGTTFGDSTAPTTYGGGAEFRGTATYAQTSNATRFSLSGTSAGSGDIAIKSGANNVSFNGSTNCNISIIADTAATNNSIVRRTSTGAINATSFSGNISGNATSASALLSGTTTYAPTSSASGSGVPLLINGTIKATKFDGEATNASYADLAENYLADADYEPGTVLEFGGEFEVTVAEDETRRVAGVVSTNPAYLMNSKLEGENVVSLALQGRVPCKVRGIIRKGDMLVSGGGGYARPTYDPKIGTIIGKALQNWDGGEGVIEIVVGRL
jgi:hypothetical protein